MLQATPTRTKGVVTKAWLFRYQIDSASGSWVSARARVVRLAEARAKANEARKLLAAGIDPLAHRNAERMAARAAELHTATFRQCLDQLARQPRRPLAQKHAAQWRNFDGDLLQAAVRRRGRRHRHRAWCSR